MNNFLRNCLYFVYLNITMCILTYLQTFITIFKKDSFAHILLFTYYNDSIMLYSCLKVDPNEDSGT